jgi:hypothetical protein
LAVQQEGEKLVRVRQPRRPLDALEVERRVAAPADAEYRPLEDP